MIDLISLLLSATGVLLTVYLEWPRIRKRVEASKLSSVEMFEETPPIARELSQGKPESLAIQEHKTSFFKTIISIFIAIVYGFIFGSIFIPFGSTSTVGSAAIVFWILSIFWAFRYIRYRSWKYISLLLVIGFISYFLLATILDAYGQL